MYDTAGSNLVFDSYIPVILRNYLTQNRKHVKAIIQNYVYIRYKRNFNYTNLGYREN